MHCEQQVCKHTLDALPFALTAFCFDTSQKYNNFTCFKVMVKTSVLLTDQVRVPPDWSKFNAF